MADKRVKLTADDVAEVRKLIAAPKNGGSDRTRDRARARLKRLGLVHFDRTAWEWVVRPAGIAALEEYVNG